MYIFLFEMEQLANIKTEGVSINAIVLKTLLIKFKQKTFCIAPEFE